MERRSTGVDEERKRVGDVRGMEMLGVGKWRYLAEERVRSGVGDSGGDSVRVGMAGESEAMDWRRRRSASCWVPSAEAILCCGADGGLDMELVDGLVLV